LLKKARAITQAVNRQLAIAAAQVRARVKSWDLWWTEWRWGRFSPTTSISPANSHSTDCSIVIIIYHLGLVQYAVPSGLMRKMKYLLQKFPVEHGVHRTAPLDHILSQFSLFQG
jgi:hypothetical protein